MTGLFFTKEENWLALWDDFLKNNSRGHFSQYTSWLASYREYGFDYELLLFVENNEIVGGCGLVLAKFSFFKFLIVPVGPIVSEFNEDKTELLFQKIHEFALKSRACYLEINIPCLANDLKSNYSSSSLKEDSFYYTGKNGTKFKYVISVDGFRFVDLSENQPEKNYNSNTKRNIKKAFDGNLEFQFAETKDQIKLAYACIEQNAKNQGYSVRSYHAFKNTLQELIVKKQGVFAICLLENKIVGSLFLIEAGNRFNYISGGIDRNYNDLKIGHFLHQKMIEFSMEKKYNVYDISVGGSAGVLRFKEGFGGKHFPFIGVKYWVLKPGIFKIFLFFEKYFKPYKAVIANIVSKFK